MWDASLKLVIHLQENDLNMQMTFVLTLSKTKKGKKTAHFSTNCLYFCMCMMEAFFVSYITYLLLFIFN
uniref:Uncharacterized protein n=1 Tax=Anguilla anguilla TaxID=7936 RepID=A0A0E9XV57_ANGAN